MEELTVSNLAKLAGGQGAKTELLGHLLSGLRNDISGVQSGILPPKVFAHYFSQIGHETANFRHSTEIWGPTPAQLRYEGRRDLGNVFSGDGKRFMGRGLIMVTGRSNYGQFYGWCRTQAGDKAGSVPDFRELPDAVAEAPWCGLSAVWYWETRKLSQYALMNDIENLTRRINGGLNGFSDRVERYTRAALGLLGYEGEGAVRTFQNDIASLVVDGIPGPRTRSALHIELSRLDPLTFPTDDGGLALANSIDLTGASQASSTVASRLKALEERVAQLEKGRGV